MTNDPRALEKVAVITGAASGIGFAIANELAENGYSIGLVDVQETMVSEAASQILRDHQIPVCAVAVDVSDSKACQDGFLKITDALGPPSVLINCAGIVVRKKARLENLPEADFKEMMDIHVGGTLNWSRLVLPAMRAAGFGCIINISSVNAIAAVPYRIGYVTAKKAIRGLTEALALETARSGITVNAIAPGYILTDVLKMRAEKGILDRDAIAERTPVGRWGEPEEVAKLAAFLASNDAAYITGTTMILDGGLSIRGDADEDLANKPE